MTAIAISDFLPDFGKPTWHVDKTASPFEPHEEPERAGDAAHPEIDVDAMVRGEVERAEAEVTERLTAHHEEMLRVERERHAEEIEHLQAELGADAGAKIASGLAEMEARATELATSAAARILSTLVGEDIQRRSVEKLADIIGGAIRESGALKVTVHGPLSLFERLSSRLGEHASNIHHIEAPNFDLVVDIDGTLFESRFAEWSASLSGALS